MNQRPVQFSSWLACCAAALTLFALAGCTKEESITAYETPRSAPAPQPLDVAAVQASLDHMLVAIVPQGDKAWFFKVVVPGRDVAGLRKAFNDFIATVNTAGGGKQPTWKLPDSWTEQPGATEMRFATITMPHSGGTAEIAVSTLPRGEQAWPAFLRDNVERWMGQLQQAPLRSETIAKISRTVPLEGGEATVLELVGTMPADKAAMPPGHPPVAGRPGDGSEAAAPAPTVTPPAETPPPAAAAAAPSQAGFEYAAPEGWTPGRLSSMRRAAFNVADGARTAEVTVMPFPANPAMTDPVAQAKRWAGEVGLAGSSEEDLKEAESPVTIDGVDGQQFNLFGPGDAAGARGTLAAMIRRGDQMWFFKMTGDRSLVESQQEAFAAFLKSIDFPAAD